MVRITARTQCIQLQFQMMVRVVCAATEALTQGRYRNSICCVMLRVDFFDVQLKDFEEFILPALRTVACVQCIGDTEAKEQQQKDKALGVDRRAQRAAVGAIEKRTVLMEKLVDVHGDGGNPSKKRKVVREVVDMLNTSQRVAASGLKEAQAPESDQSSDEK